MNPKDNIKVTVVEQVDGRRIFTLSVSDQNDQREYKIYASDNDISKKDGELTTEELELFALEQMQAWLDDTEGKLPKSKFLLLTSGGRIPTDDIESLLYIKKKVSDLVRTNVTISAPLFEWAKTKSQTEGTSFSELVSRGLTILKDSDKENVFDKEVETWFKEQGDYFKTKLGKFGSFEVSHYLPNNSTEFSPEVLKTALQTAEVKRTGWPIGVYLTNSDNRPVVQEDGIKAEYADNSIIMFDYWYAKYRGEFYFSRILESDNGNGTAEPKTSLYFDTLIWRVAEALEHSLAYYKNLKINEDEKVKFKISLYGLNGRKLSAWNPMRAFTLHHYICGSDKSSWELEISLHELSEKLDEVIYEATKKLLVMFDFFVPGKEVVFDILNREYRKSNF